MLKQLSRVGVFSIFMLMLGCQTPVAGGQQQSGMLRYDGLDRSYVYSVPPAVAGKKYPLVVLLHGALGSGEQIWRYNALPELAKREGFILMAPSGINNIWNDGRPATLSGRKSTADDAGFLIALIDKAIAEYGADPHRVYMTGVSNGGLMTFRMLCEHGERFAAVAPVIATLPKERAETCSARQVIPIQLTLGTADPLLPYEGGANDKTGVTMLSGPAAFDFFAARAGCRDHKNVEFPDLDKDDGSTITEITGVGCSKPVQMLRVNGGGHQWINGRDGWLFRQIVGRANRDSDGAELVWNFFKTQSRPN